MELFIQPSCFEVKHNFLTSAGWNIKRISELADTFLRCSEPAALPPKERKKPLASQYPLPGGPLGSLPGCAAELGEILTELFSGCESSVPHLGLDALLQQDVEMPVFPHAQWRIVQQSPGAASPRGVAGQQVLTDGVVVVVHGDPRAQSVFGE